MDGTTSAPVVARERRTARAVTYGAVALLLAVALVQLELWPLTAYRLFSNVRTDSRVTLELVAVGDDGATTPVRLPSDRVLGTTAHQYRDLEKASDERRRELVAAWLSAGSLDADEVAEVRLDRVRQRMDPATLRWSDVERTVVVEVPLGGATPEGAA